MVSYRVLWHAANLRHGANGFTSLPKEGMLRIFFARKKSDGFGRERRVPEASMLTTRPPRPLACWITQATSTHSEYVILIAFVGATRFCERASLLTYIRMFPVLVAEWLVCATCLLLFPHETLDPYNAVTDTILWFIIIRISSIYAESLSFVLLVLHIINSRRI
jgi:hypothetical protein